MTAEGLRVFDSREKTKSKELRVRRWEQRGEREYF